MRDLLLRAAVGAGVFAVLITELLSPFHLLRRGPILAAWIAGATLAGLWLYRRPSLARPAPKPFEAAIAAVIGCIAFPVGLTAWLSAPNSYDVLAYHMPRVVYWAQSGSVAFFPTTYLSQNSLPPLAEYFMLHTYLVSGGDRFANLVAFAAFVGCVIGVSSLAGAFGALRRAQALAAFFCATLPSAILHASVAKNDSLLALWLVAMAYFAARRNAPLAGLSFGLALATKSTAFLFAPPVLAGVVLWHWLGKRRAGVAGLAVSVALGAILLNAALWRRNVQMSGSPLGFDAPSGAGGPFRWANARFGWQPTLSNILRSASDQVGGRSARWNGAVYDAAIRLHRLFGIDPDGPDWTWGGSHFPPPMNTAHEASANNRWHLALLVLAAGAAIRFAGRKRDFAWALHAAALAVGYLLFCAYVKWEPKSARLLLPLFMLAAPLGGWLLDRMRPILTLALCVFLLDGVRLPLLKNWTRPLAGPNSLLAVPRERSYFNEVKGLPIVESYERAVELTAASGCDAVGLDVAWDQAEYPFQALLRARRPAARFRHVGVENASSRYYPAAAERPCAVLCISCELHPERVERYRAAAAPIGIGGFALFLDPSRQRLPAR